MGRAAWYTDVHLNFLDNSRLGPFYRSMAAEEADVVLISGDIGEAPDVARILTNIADAVQRPVYFVLGNHDFYRSSVRDTRFEIGKLAGENEHLVYLNDMDPVELGPNTALVGHDGWGDARLGDYDNSPVLLNDHFLIAELSEYVSLVRDVIQDREATRRRLEEFGDQAAAHLERVLPLALDSHENV
ncbi:MAG: metallophosphoesterase, partial [Planctomycetales bacterium]